MRCIFISSVSLMCLYCIGIICMNLITNLYSVPSSGKKQNVEKKKNAPKRVFCRKYDGYEEFCKGLQYIIITMATRSSVISCLFMQNIIFIDLLMYLLIMYLSDFEHHNIFIKILIR